MSGWEIAGILSGAYLLCFVGFAALLQGDSMRNLSMLEARVTKKAQMREEAAQCTTIRIR